MKFYIVSALLILVSFNIRADERLKKYCSQIGGNVVNEFTCPKSKLKLKFDFCLTKDDLGRMLFFDGCTGPSGGHADLFYPACIKHDYCYHHEPNTHGYTRSDCDHQFLNNTLDLCAKAEDQKDCRLWAQSMYRALRMFGDVAFNCAKYEADY